MEKLLKIKNTYALKTKFVYFILLFKLIFASFVFGSLFFITNNYLFVKHFYIALCVILFFQLLIYFAIRKIIKRNSVICRLLHQYAIDGENICEEFLSPKKNIKKSFNFQQDGLEKTTKSLNQINSMIAATKEQIQDCNEIIKVSKNKLEKGKDVMRNLESTIETIKQATKDMDLMLKIINEINIKSSVITEIVAKTELLAMNASIEAARAGEFGKGFSVVSEEVGDLARNSGKSAKQIKELLNESSMKVSQVLRTTDERIKQGEIICKKVLTAFDNIQLGIKQLKDQANIILNGTEMQSNTIKESSEMIEKLASSVGTNAQLLDKIEDAIEDLMKNNNNIFALSEKMHEAISGTHTAEKFKDNRASFVRRTLLELDM